MPYFVISPFRAVISALGNATQKVSLHIVRLGRRSVINIAANVQVAVVAVTVDNAVNFSAAFDCNPF